VRDRRAAAERDEEMERLRAKMEREKEAAARAAAEAATKFKAQLQQAERRLQEKTEQLKAAKEQLKAVKEQLDAKDEKLKQTEEQLADASRHLLARRNNITIVNDAHEAKVESVKSQAARDVAAAEAAAAAATERQIVLRIQVVGCNEGADPGAAVVAVTAAPAAAASAENALAAAAVATDIAATHRDVLGGEELREESMSPVQNVGDAEEGVVVAEMEMGEGGESRGGGGASPPAALHDEGDEVEAIGTGGVEGGVGVHIVGADGQRLYVHMGAPRAPTSLF
jgi:chromosome segregation ATPase